MKRILTFAAAILLSVALTQPVKAQVNPAEQDIYGFGPQIGAPVVHLPDGRRLSCSVWYQPWLGLGFVSAMVYEENVGAFLWRQLGTQYAYWEAETPTSGVDPDRTLSWIIEDRGGPAQFILASMANCSAEIAGYLGFNPSWGYTSTSPSKMVSISFGAWGIKSIVPSNPALLVLVYPY